MLLPDIGAWFALLCPLNADGSNLLGSDARGFITFDGFRSPLMPNGLRVIFDGFCSSSWPSSVGEMRLGGSFEDDCSSIFGEAEAPS